MKINIPRILVYLRGKVTERRKGTWAGRLDPEALAMAVMGRIFQNPRLFAWAQRAAALGQLPFMRQGTIRHLPGPLSGWTAMRDLAPVPKQSFRDWWRKERS